MKGSPDRSRWPGEVRGAHGAAEVSRRQFIQTTAGVAAAVGMGTGMGLGWPATAEAQRRKLPRSTGVIADCSPAPIPIPGGFNIRDVFGPRFPDRFLHLFLPGPGAEPSTIFDFEGDVAVFNILGTGTRTELDDDGAPIGSVDDIPFVTDVRFMDGVYVGVDGKKHMGTFGFY